MRGFMAGLSVGSRAFADETILPESRRCVKRGGWIAAKRSAGPLVVGQAHHERKTFESGGTPPKPPARCAGAECPDGEG